MSDDYMLDILHDELREKDERIIELESKFSELLSRFEERTGLIPELQAKVGSLTVTVERYEKALNAMEDQGSRCNICDCWEIAKEALKDNK